MPRLYRYGPYVPLVFGVLCGAFGLSEDIDPGAALAVGRASNILGFTLITLSFAWIMKDLLSKNR